MRGPSSLREAIVATRPSAPILALSPRTLQRVRQPLFILVAAIGPALLGACTASPAATDRAVAATARQTAAHRDPLGVQLAIVTGEAEALLVALGPAPLTLAADSVTTLGRQLDSLVRAVRGMRLASAGGGPDSPHHDAIARLAQLTAELEPYRSVPNLASRLGPSLDMLLALVPPDRGALAVGPPSNTGEDLGGYDGPPDPPPPTRVTVRR